MQLLDALLTGERDPPKLGALRDRPIKASEATIAKASFRVVDSRWLIPTMSVLADWLVRQAPAWLVPASAGSITPAQRRALHAILRFRTPALGGHVYQCTDCQGTDFAYHSCHHRACPRRGGARTAA